MVDTLGTAVDELPALGALTGDRLRLVPIIVVARVEENRVVERHIHAVRYPKVYLDLHLVRCARENTLKGGVTGSELTFFYFADTYGQYQGAAPNPRYRHLFAAEPEFRYVFFLTREGKVLRSFGDVGDYSVLVSSGKHAESPGQKKDLGEALAAILLTPGDGANLERMARQLFVDAQLADTWGYPLLTAKLLRNLFTLREPIRSEACGELVRNYQGQSDCLSELGEGPEESSALRKGARQTLAEQRALLPVILKDLRDPAQLAFFPGDSRRRVREQLEVVLLGKDRQLRAGVCRALRRYYPYDAEAGCSGP